MLQGRNRCEREAFAAVVQGTAAETVKALLLRLHKGLGYLDRGSAAAPASPPGSGPMELASPAAAAGPRIMAVCRDEVVIEARECHSEALLQVCSSTWCCQ